MLPMKLVNFIWNIPTVEFHVHLLQNIILPNRDEEKNANLYS